MEAGYFNFRFVEQISKVFCLFRDNRYEGKNDDTLFLFKYGLSNNQKFRDYNISLRCEQVVPIVFPAEVGATMSVIVIVNSTSIDEVFLFR
jgi:hypothetical protein